MLLAEILSDNDFDSRVQGLALKLRKKLGIDAPVYQLGVVVDNVETAAEKLERKGMKPFLLLGGSAERWSERGVDGHMRSRLGFGYHRGIEIELLEPGEGTDFYRRSLDQRGRPLIQHLGFLVKDVDAWANKLVNAGYPVYVRGKLGMGPLSIDFAYMDTERDDGLILEFISHRFLGIWFKPPIWFQQLLGLIEKKTGKRCIDVG
ncbi:MAG: hypothetical protein A2176_13855 [Spirochaetes bacterium RBG_13_51_14]|nr:MAG: hypothetical protein A2176_13855 [Spirochaetes bacterium RBG_13_51_14]